MANMSYCRFQNTLGDFKACLRALEDDDLHNLSDEEFYAAKRLVILAARMVEAFPLEDFETAEEARKLDNEDSDNEED